MGAVSNIDNFKEQIVSLQKEAKGELKVQDIVKKMTVEKGGKPITDFDEKLKVLVDELSTKDVKKYTDAINALGDVKGLSTHFSVRAQIRTLMERSTGKAHAFTHIGNFLMEGINGLKMHFRGLKDEHRKDLQKLIDEFANKKPGTKKELEKCQTSIKSMYDKVDGFLKGRAEEKGFESLRKVRDDLETMWLETRKTIANIQKPLPQIPKSAPPPGPVVARTPEEEMQVDRIQSLVPVEITPQIKKNIGLILNEYFSKELGDAQSFGARFTRLFGELPKPQQNQIAELLVFVMDLGQQVPKNVPALEGVTVEEVTDEQRDQAVEGINQATTTEEPPVEAEAKVTKEAVEQLGGKDTNLYKQYYSKVVATKGNLLGVGGNARGASAQKRVDGIKKHLGIEEGTALTPDQKLKLAAYLEAAHAYWEDQNSRFNLSQSDIKRYSGVHDLLVDEANKYDVNVKNYTKITK